MFLDDNASPRLKVVEAIELLAAVCLGAIQVGGIVGSALLFAGAAV